MFKIRFISVCATLDWFRKTSLLGLWVFVVMKGGSYFYESHLLHLIIKDGP